MSIQRLSNSGQSGFRYKSLIAGITPVASVPTVGTATALTFSTASVTFTAPGAYAGSTYTATSSPGGLTGTSASSPITVSGLSENTAYTFTVTAGNGTGTSRPSAASNSITTPSAFTPESGYDALATVTLSSSASSVTFSGIPAGYKHLQIRVLGRTDGTGNRTATFLQFNGDTASNYRWHGLAGSGASISGEEAGSAVAAIRIGSSNLPMGDAGSNIFGVSVADILDYANVNKNKVTRALAGADQNATTGRISFVSGLWFNTAAVTSIKVYPEGANWAQYSSIALYGVK